jgi:hypothetical protein
MNMSKLYLEAYIASVELDVPTIRDDDEDVKEFMNNKYFKARKKIPVPNPPSDDENAGVYLFLGIAAFVVFAMATLLLIIYIKRKKNDETLVEEEIEP